MDTKPLQLFYTDADEANQFRVRILPFVQERDEELPCLFFQNPRATRWKGECVTE